MSVGWSSLRCRFVPPGPLYAVHHLHDFFHWHKRLILKIWMLSLQLLWDGEVPSSKVLLPEAVLFRFIFATLRHGKVRQLRDAVDLNFSLFLVQISVHRRLSLTECCYLVECSRDFSLRRRFRCEPPWRPPAVLSMKFADEDFDTSDWIHFSTFRKDIAADGRLLLRWKIFLLRIYSVTQIK